MSYSILTHNVNNILSYETFDRSCILNSIKSSNLLGRGGAAFPVYKKWEPFIASTGQKKYVIINLHEGEPGCRKDAYLVRHNAHAVIDGALITRFVTNATDIILAVKDSIAKESDICRIAELHNIGIHTTCADYIAGEESALIELLETGFAYPRLRPPYPVTYGLYGCPTLVHNAETFANISYIARHGDTHFNIVGTRTNRGTKIFCISGDVNNECVFEESFGVSLKKAINDYAGGLKNGDLCIVIPGFSRMIKECLTINLDYESFANAGSHLGTGNIFVFTNKESLLQHIRKMIAFLCRSSCGQCSTCRIICKMSNVDLEQNSCNANKLEEIATSVRGFSRCSLMNSILDMLTNYVEALQC